MPKKVDPTTMPAVVDALREAGKALSFTELQAATGRSSWLLRMAVDELYQERVIDTSVEPGRGHKMRYWLTGKDLPSPSRGFDCSALAQVWR